MDPTVTSDPPARRHRLRSSPTIAAVLSFVVPGAGQLARGRIRAGLLFLSPLVALIALGAVATTADRGTLLGVLLEPGMLVALLVADMAILAWRAIAIVDAWWHAGDARSRGLPGAVAVVVLVGIVSATHVAVGAQLVAARETVDAVFGSTDDGGDGFGAVPGGSDGTETDPPASPTQRRTFTPFSPMAPATSADPTIPPSPTATPTPGPLDDGRLDVLLIGADSGPGRWSLRTDTMIVLSVDVRSGEAALFSIPRNMVNVPLPRESRDAFRCRCFPHMINGLYVYASGHPGSFPGKDATRGLRAIQGAIGTLIDRRLDGMVVVELQGFVRLIDAIGGLDIDIPEAVHDQRYPLENGRGYVEVHIRAGKQHLDGRRALMYARSRHQDSDYGRMERQQVVLTALGRQLQRESLLVRLPELMAIAKEHLWTNLRLRDLPDLMQLAEQTDVKGMQRIRFVPRWIPEHLDKAAIKRIRTAVAEVFDDAEPLPTASPGRSPNVD